VFSEALFVTGQRSPNIKLTVHLFQMNTNRHYETDTDTELKTASVFIYSELNQI